MNDTVKCPYCGYENDMSDGCVDLPSDNKFDHECENCGKEFEVEVEFNPSYSANKIEFEKCDICGSWSRDTIKRGWICPFPKNTNKDNLCQSCWRKLVLEEMKNENQSVLYVNTKER